MLRFSYSFKRVTSKLIMSSRTLFIVLFNCIVLFGLLILTGESLNDSGKEVSHRISIAKCTEYQRVCPSESSPFNIDGEFAAAKEFPHMALIGYERKNETVWLCSGTLISENFVLSAAQCVTSRDHSAHFVRLGDLDFNTTHEDAEVREFNITQSILHPDFHPRSAYHDIVLLKLDRPVEFSPYIRPACLPHPNTANLDRLIATGWGQTSQLSDKLPSSLQKVLLNFAPFDVCKEMYDASRRLLKGISNETQLCAGSGRGERDACSGFAGGSLLNTGRKFSCLHEIVGITSLGKQCSSGHPGVYTRVASYIDWIEGIVWPEG